MNNQINLEYLYLDLTVCTRCKGSDLNLERAVEDLKKKYPGKNIQLKKIHINSIDLALKEKIISSPTIRINGQDLPIELKESNCDSCGDYCGDNVDCRIWVYNGTEYDSAPIEMIIDLVSKYIKGNLELDQTNAEYSIPYNIVHFFASRLKKEEVKSEEVIESCCCTTSPTASCCS